MEDKEGGGGERERERERRGARRLVAQHVVGAWMFYCKGTFREEEVFVSPSATVQVQSEIYRSVEDRVEGARGTTSKGGLSYFV